MITNYQTYFILKHNFYFKVKEDCLANEMLWQSVSVSLMDCELRRSLLKRVLDSRKLCLEGFLLTYYRQFPLPSFALAHCNSVEGTIGNSQHDALTAGRVFFDQGRAILRSYYSLTQNYKFDAVFWCFILISVLKLEQWKNITSGLRQYDCKDWEFNKFNFVSTLNVGYNENYQFFSECEN